MGVAVTFWWCSNRSKGFHLCHVLIRAAVQSFGEWVGADMSKDRVVVVVEVVGRGAEVDRRAAW